MDNMEKYVKYTKLRLIVMSMSTLSPIIIILIMNLIDIPNIEQTIFKDMLQPDMIVFTYLLLAVLEAVIISKIVKYIKILKNDDYREKLYIKKYDERNKYIQMRSGELISKIFIYVMLVVCIFTAFTNRELFYPLLLVLLIYLLIYGIVTITFRKKY